MMAIADNRHLNYDKEIELLQLINLGDAKRRIKCKE